MSMFRSAGRKARSTLAIVGVVAVGGAALMASGFQLPNPFATTEKQRDHVAVLAELSDLSHYSAATGRFSTIVDIEEDADYLPDFVKGERTMFVAEADVEAFVDFSELTADGIQVSADGSSVTVTVPEPRLSDPTIDPDATYVASRERGLLDRAEDAITGGSPTDDQFLYQEAQDQLAEAASQSELRDRARTNTDQFLTSLIEGLGYEDVTVTFETPAPSAQS